MIDNVTLKLAQPPPKAILKARGKPVEVGGLIYSPCFRDGELIRFESSLKNLKVIVFPNCVYLKNSLHKYWHHGGNFDNFYCSEISEAIATISDVTKFNWLSAEVKRIEVACNVDCDANKAALVLKSYKTKPFQPMSYNGKVYGTKCDFQNYSIRGYNKAFVAQRVDGIGISQPLFRWESQFHSMQYFARVLSLPMTVSDLLKLQNLKIMADTSIKQFQQTIKLENLNLTGLSAEEKKVIGVMLNDELREDFKLHHKEAFKKYRPIFKRILASQNNEFTASLEDSIKQKFGELLNG